MTITLASATYAQQHQLNPNPTAHIETSTLEYLHTAFLLYEYKTNYSKRDYKIQLEICGWNKGSFEEKRALKIGQYFQDFVSCPQQLAPIPVTILLKLCSKEYRPILDLITNYPPGGLTCEIVLNLIEERKALIKAQKEQELKPKEEEKPVIWRRVPSGARYCQFPPVWEDDERTGVLTQRLIDEHGMIPQTILREAVADYYEKIMQATEQSQTETSESIFVTEPETFSSSEILAVEISEAIQDDSSIVEPEQIVTHEIEEVSTHDNHQEDNSLTDNVTVAPNAEEQETLVLIEKLEAATSYYQIRSALYRHQSVKDKAIEQLSEAEKSRIEELLPLQVKALNKARESNLILDYYELETGSFQIFIEGEDRPVSVSKSSVLSWLKEQERINSITV
ncbi:hypothetical protein DSM106972_066960 [Dulcicalothrix desertica PCC 7102]|uniref:Uncharacterized protein n=1 Tax=Dulcicalothrix desertica PCC 7102 TaxID=232991 RepID=A0A433V6B5_9CYAN|nr:hypothetical protein [Dulcicalothrix desertica]RUT01599.1 hypothetical protein DSM106972_066960 [Dulcicalothrix desertica PCC 7102]